MWFVFQTWGIVRTNRELIMGTKVYPKEDRYEFKQVAILELTYIVNFGSELAVSMLPLRSSRLRSICRRPPLESSAPALPL